jgi:hypothetical protein
LKSANTELIQILVIPISTVIDKNEDGSDITQDVDVLFWWRDVGQDRFSRITVMTRQFLTITATSVTDELKVCLVLLV